MSKTPNGRYLSESSRQKMFALIVRGDRYEDIAAEFSIDPSAVGHAARRAGIYRGKGEPTGRKAEWIKRQQNVAARTNSSGVRNTR